MVVVSGLPGAGKSSTARALAKRYPRAVHVEADRLQEMIVTGAVLPGLGGISDDAREQLDLRLVNACALARSFREAGFLAIVDDIVIGDAIDRLEELLDGVDFHFVMLDPAFEHVKRRWIAMASPFAESWDWIDDIIRNHTRRIGLWLDTTDLDVEATVDVIAAHVTPR